MTARTVRDDLRIGVGHVVSTELVTPRRCRVEIASGGLRGFDPDGRVAQHLKLVLPGPGQAQPTLPLLGDRGPSFPDESARSPLRTFTVRSFDAGTHTLVLEVVLHEGGLASEWARRAAPGDPVGLIGPAGGHRVRYDLGRYVLAGDETAVPAIAGIVESLAPDQAADVLIEVADEADRRPLLAEGDVRVRWLFRRGHAHGRLLERAFGELEIIPGRTFVWAAGEAAAIRRIRRSVRDDLALPRSDFEIGGYWLRRVSEDEGVARNRAAWEAALASGKSEAEIEDALLY